MGKRAEERKAMTIIGKKRARTPQERLQALDQRLARLVEDKRLTVEMRDQILDMRSQIPATLQKGNEVQRVAAGAGDIFIRAVQMVFQHRNYPLPEI
jgi:hypothetical protein